MEKTALIRVENKVRQQLFGLVTLATLGLMIMNSLGLLVYGDADQTNLSFNVSSGSFTIANAPTQMSFTGQTYGVGNNVTGNVDVDAVAVTDYRGNSASWTVAVNANDLSDGTNTIYANKLTLYQDVRGTLTNIENSTTSKVTLGANGTLNAGGVTLMNTSSSAGIIQFDNGFVNLLYTGTDSAGNYGAIMVYTLT